MIHNKILSSRKIVVIMDSVSLKMFYFILRNLTILSIIVDNEIHSRGGLFTADLLVTNDPLNNIIAEAEHVLNIWRLIDFNTKKLSVGYANSDSTTRIDRRWITLKTFYKPLIIIQKFTVFITCLLFMNTLFKEICFV